MPPMITKRLHLVPLALCFAAVDARAGEAALKDAVPHITVVGRAHAEVVPNLAILDLAVVTERPKSVDAASENARTVQALVDEIKAQGIEARDIKTISITLAPVYETDYGVSRVSKRTLRGYSVHNSFEIRVRSLDKVGTLARQLIDRGANEFHSIRFEYEHADEAYDRLRDEAMRDALRRAKDYLPAVGSTLGRIIEISPGEPSAEARYKSSDFAGGLRAPSEESASIPIEPGSETLQTEVQVTWEVVPVGR